MQETFEFWKNTTVAESGSAIISMYFFAVRKQYTFQESTSFSVNGFLAASKHRDNHPKTTAVLSNLSGKKKASLRGNDDGV